MWIHILLIDFFNGYSFLIYKFWPPLTLTWIITSQQIKKFQKSAKFTNGFTKFTNHKLNIITDFTLLSLLIGDECSGLFEHGDIRGLTHYLANNMTVGMIMSMFWRNKLKISFYSQNVYYYLGTFLGSLYCVSSCIQFNSCADLVPILNTGEQADTEVYLEPLEHLWWSFCAKVSNGWK